MYSPPTDSEGGASCSQEPGGDARGCQHQSGDQSNRGTGICHRTGGQSKTEGAILF